jgi:hypothetical protein
MIIITFILFFINIVLEFTIKLFLFKIVYIKVFLLLSMLCLLYKIYTYPKRQRLRLSSLRRMKQFFPYQYKITSIWEELKSLCIWICYILIFVCGLLLLRFNNASREVNLKVSGQKLYDIFLKCDWISLMLNIGLITVSIALYYYGFSYIVKYFKFHSRRLHYYYYNGLIKNISFKYYFYNKLCDKLSYSTTDVYSKFADRSNYILYYLGLKKAYYRVFTSTYGNIHRSFNLITWEKPMPLGNLFYGYLNAYEHKLHLHLLCLIFIFDLFYNNGILKHIYMIMPYIFLYELWVRYSKMITFKNRIYDVVLHYFIHKPLLEVDDTFMTFGDRTFEKTDLQCIMINYVHNDFRDKEIIARWEKINREYNPVQLLETILGYPFYYTLFMCFVFYLINLYLTIS